MAFVADHVDSLKKMITNCIALQTGISGLRCILRRTLAQNILEVMVEELKRYPYTSLLDKNICDVFLF
jgi:hypothetical protein